MNNEELRIRLDAAKNLADCCGGSCEIAREGKLVLHLDDLRRKAEKALLVPGHFECVKCGFYLISQTLNIPSGNVSANEEPQRCGNGCGPMWNVSWVKYAGRQYETTEKLQETIEKLRDRNTTLKRVLKAVQFETSNLVDPPLSPHTMELVNLALVPEGQP